MSQSSPYFFALPNDIYDALVSSPQKYPMTRLREHALRKGLVVSPKLDREALCMRIAQLPYSYNEFQELSESLMSKAKSPRSESTSLDKHISSKNIVNVLDNLKKEYPGKVFNVAQKNNGATTIKVEYDDIKHGQTRLKQRQRKESVIEISADKGVESGKIISSATPQARSIISSLIKFIETEEKIEIQTKKINLSNFTTSQINSFFMNLANSIPSLNFDTAKSVKVRRSNNEDDIDENDIDEEAENTQGALLTEINNASLAGSNVLESPQVKEFLRANEYHIHTLQWQSVEVPVDGTDGAKLLVEIKATPANDCSNFQFDVLSYKHRNKSSNQFVKNFSRISSLAKAEFVEMIHKRAFEVYQEISDETSVEQS